MNNTTRAALLLALPILAAAPAAAQTPDSAFAVSRNGVGLFRVNVDGGALWGGTYTSMNPSGVPKEGAGTRMVWYPAKAAFRAGYIDGTQWDDANIGPYSVAMGQSSRALGDYSVAIGNRAVAANIGTVAFGEEVTATGANSVVLGYRASTSTAQGSPKLGSFVFGDRSSASTGDTIHAIYTNAAFWRVAGGNWIYTSTNLSTGMAVLPPSGTNQQQWAGCGTHTAGTIFLSTSTCATLTAGGVWTNSSDVNRKHLFETVYGEDVLARLRSVPIRSWSYKAEDASVRHLGPTAQDFRAAFGLGSNETTITTIDADGVALAGVQALDRRTTEQRDEIARLRAENQALAERVARLEALIQAQTKNP